jgi:hypothetical protein
VPSAGAVYVELVRLKVSRSPIAELGAAAQQAADRAGLKPGVADFIIVAVEPGHADAAVAAVERAARDAEAPAP